MVSVIVPVFNGGRFLPIALQSVGFQDYGNLEVVGVDDGSTDKSLEILESFRESGSRPMKILTHPGGRRMGIAASYRLGLGHSEGEFIAFLEQDDAWEANRISTQIEIFETFPEVGVVFSDVHTWDEAGQVATDPFQALLNSTPKERPFRAFRRLLWGNCLSTFSNVMVRRSQLQGSSDIISEPEGFQDWMFLLQISRRCHFYHSNRSRTLWRQRPDSYHATLRREPGYRKRRKLALRAAVDKTLVDAQTSPRSREQRLRRAYWLCLTSALNSLEGVAGFFRGR